MCASGAASPFKSLAPCGPTMQFQMVALCKYTCSYVLVTVLCLAFSGADTEFDFVLMTSAYTQYLRDSCKQHLTLVGS